MIPGLRGALLSHDALERAVPRHFRGELGEADAEAARRRARAALAPGRALLGPTASARAVYDRVALPLAQALGYHIVIASAGDTVAGWLLAGGTSVAGIVVTPWGVDPGSAWRHAVRQGIAGGLRWCFCVTGPALRLVDSRRTYSRRHAEFDLTVVVEDSRAFAMLYALLRADAVAQPAGRGLEPLLDRVVQLCERHRAEVRSSLQSGVEQALVHLLGAFVCARGSRRRAAPPILSSGMFDESLIVVYRVLFLLFAEARGLVPRWHPVYRDGYTIEALRGSVEMKARPRGLWESLQAIARLAHRGCHAGSLRVPPFNGRLFSPSAAPLADSLPLDDGAVRNALVSLTTRSAKAGIERISYGDLGVEQLGGVYERILDFEPSVSPAAPWGVTLVRAGRRKASGSFYTPRSLTEYLVRRTLAPLVSNASPERILSLRIVDPAMGSGAFLVAVCRYLATAYEEALVREGGLRPDDITDHERASFRRAVAQRCLFGVDVNPMAVQLARLSLWLATLAADRPLTFLDHHLRAGDSLLGASLNDIVRHPFAKPRHRSSPLPLFDDAALDEALQATVASRLSLANDPGDTLDQVRQKERLLARLDDDGPLTKWKRVADLWCARWFPPSADHAAAERLRSAQRRGVFAALSDELLGRGGGLPPHVSGPLLADVRAIATAQRFFHWTLEFPEVFAESTGFDAVLGNPPWEMLREDRGHGEAPRAAPRTGMIAAFARGSGVYRLQSDGHANLYQLFVERALSLTGSGGRIGIVLPSGFATDHGCSTLRREVFGKTTVDTFVVLENRDGLFPIHRGLKFLLMCATAGGRTDALPLRAGVRSVDTLDELADAGPDMQALHVRRDLLERVSGPQLAVPDLRTGCDVDIVAKITLSTPALGAADGWNVHFGRELNATDDRRHFIDAAHALPVVEGKHLRPFAVDVAAARHHIPRAVAARLLPAKPYERPRLAYRDVAAATNRTTLIAAIVPASAVTTHTLFCLKDRLNEDEQMFLCGMFNSYVANYLVRLRVTTHVTVAIVDRLPMPRPPRTSPAFREMVALANRIARDAADRSAAASLQALAASLYGLDAAEFEHVLNTFPLVDAAERGAALETFRDP